MEDKILKQLNLVFKERFQAGLQSLANSVPKYSSQMLISKAKENDFHA